MIPALLLVGGIAKKGVLYFISNPKVLLGVATAISLAFMYFQVQFYQGKVNRLAEENSALRVSLVLIEQDLKIQKEVQKINSKRIAAQEAAQLELDTVIDVIDKTPASEDGPVAPVLRKELERP